MAPPGLLRIGHGLVLQRPLVGQQVLPLPVALLVQRDIERSIAAGHHPPVHRDDVGLGHPQGGGDVADIVGVEIGILEGVDVLLHPPQVEEQLLLRGGGADLHQAPRAQDEFLNARLDPPHRIRRQPEAAVRLELLDPLHQPDVALGDQLGHRQAIAAIAHGDLRHEPQMAGHQLARRLGIAMLLEPLGEHVFLLGGQQRKLAYLGQIAVEPGLAHRHRQRAGQVALAARFVLATRRPRVQRQRAIISGGGGRRGGRVEPLGRAVRHCGHRRSSCAARHPCGTRSRHPSIGGAQ